MPWLSLSIAIPLLAAVAAVVAGGRWRSGPFAIAIAATLASALCLLAVTLSFDPSEGMQQVERATWIPSLDIAWQVGVDGMALALAWLTVVLFAAAVIYGVGPRPMNRTAASLLLLLEGASLTFFLAEDFFLFYIAFDVTLVAMYFLIVLWGEENRRYAGLKFLLYTLIGSLPVLLGIIALYLASEPQTFDMIRLAQEQPIAGAGLGATLTFIAFLVGFAIKTPIVPFHTWLPAAHVEAPTTGSVLLAGVLLKMGTYGLIRINLQMLPDAFAEYALIIALMGLVSVIYGALVALAQTDLKRMIAYTSINHMGYVVIGVSAAAATGVSASTRDLAIDGAILQMIAHGLVTATLFFVAGFVKSRTGTRELGRLGGLIAVMPWLGALVALTFFASLGLPGLAQFPAELQIFLAAFDVWPLLTGVAVVGIVITAALFLRALQRAFLGEAPQRLRSLPDLSRRELLAVGPLVALFVLIGVYPTLVLELIDASAWLTGG